MLPIGTRVQLHPATDRWMMGDRYGTVTGYGRRRKLKPDLPSAIRYMVTLDHSGKRLRFVADDVIPVD